MLMQERDQQVKFGHSLIQHGKSNDRIYIMDYKYALDPYLINKMDVMVKDFDYGKIIAKVHKAAKVKFDRHDYEIEAVIPEYYNGKNPCFFMAKYNNEIRREVKDKSTIDVNLKKIQYYDVNKSDFLSEEFTVQVLLPENVDVIADLYKKVYDSHGLPIYDERYIQKTMSKDIVYFGMYYKDELIGVSSSHFNSKEENAKMTEFAILPKYRGHQLARHLLTRMEEAMKAIGMKTSFAFSRSSNLPMNATFAKANYEYGGTLWNNTLISGKIESMNVWYKSLVI